MNFWDHQFSVEGFKYGTQPNEFLRTQAPRLPPGARVLLPGDGEGRNSVWLAGLGHRVLAVDLSEVGLRKARALAEARGVRIETEQADLADWAPRPGGFDAVVLTYLHLPPALRAPVHRRLAGALRPGGLLILEAFHPGQLDRTSGGPKQRDMLYPLATIEADFDGWLVHELGEETEVVLDEGPGHQGPACVTRYLGRRA